MSKVTCAHPRTHLMGFIRPEGVVASMDIYCEYNTNSEREGS